jgi:hypothetical protein
MPIGAIEDRRARGDFKAFRNTFASTPRKVDYVWTTIARALGREGPWQDRYERL